jgi:hypothetical protein
MNKGQTNSKPKLAGLNEIDVTTAQENTPATDFAGARKLNLTWIMQPVIAFMKPTPQEAGKGK